MPMKFFGCLGVIVCLAGGSGWAETPRHPRSEGLSGSIGFDYDGSRARTDPFCSGVEIEWGSVSRWLSLDLDEYSSLTRDWNLSRNTEASMGLGMALWRDTAAEYYVNATLEVSLPSLQSSGGVDITPEISIAKGITDSWWVGASLSGVFATSPDAGNRRGYGSTTLWIYWASSWLPNESDSLTLSVWAATSEVPGEDQALFTSLEYAFDVAEDWEFSIGIGTDILSPWDHLGVYGTAGLAWRF